MRVLRGLAYGLGAIALLILLVVIGARFADGPLGLLPGGALVSGELVSAREVDWSFATDLDTIELQLVEPERSRTVWLAVRDGALYIPASMDFPPFKTWPEEAARDGRSVVRALGKRYERELVAVKDPEERSATLSILVAKYPSAQGSVEADRLWLFRIDPRGE
jgi:hypothetical protein